MWDWLRGLVVSSKAITNPSFPGVCLLCTKSWSYLKSSFLFPVTRAVEHIIKDHREMCGGRVGGEQTEEVLQKLDPRGMQWCYLVHTVYFRFLFRCKLEVCSLATLEFSSFSNKQEKRKVVKVGWLLGTVDGAKLLESVLKIQAN